jgi:hypothetical protein
MPKGHYDRTKARQRGETIAAHAARMRALEGKATMPAPKREPDPPPQPSARLDSIISKIAAPEGDAPLHSFRQLPTGKELIPPKPPTPPQNGNGKHYDRSGPRVRWTEEERQKLVTTALILWRKYPEGGIGINLINLAQGECFTSDRRRVLYGPSNCEDILDNVIAQAKEITSAEAASIEPEVKIIEKIVEKSADPEKVLANISTSKLISIVEARKYEEILDHHRQIVYATATGKMPEKRAVKETETMMADLGISEAKDVRTLYPKICLVGFSNHYADQVRNRVGRHALHIYHVINSNTPATESAIPLTSADYFVIDKDQTPDDWQKLVQRLVTQEKIKPDQYVHGSSINRVIDNLHKLSGDWLVKHPDYAKLHAALWAGR